MQYATRIYTHDIKNNTKWNKTKVNKRTEQYCKILLCSTPVLTIEEMHCESPLVLQMEADQALHNEFAQLCSFSQQIVIIS